MNMCLLNYHCKLNLIKTHGYKKNDEYIKNDTL